MDPQATMYLGWPLIRPADRRVKPTAFHYFADNEEFVSREDDGEWVRIRTSRGETTYRGLLVVIVNN